MMGMGMFGASGWYGGMLLYGLSFLLVIAGLGFLFYSLVSRGSQHASSGSADGLADPGKVLGTRYARGEISREEFLQMQRDIGLSTKKDEDR